MPRKRRPVLSPPEQAAAEREELASIRQRLVDAGISAHLLRQLLIVAAKKGGLAGFDAFFRKVGEARRTRLARFIDKECAAHDELHKLIDDPLDPECHPKRSPGCFSKNLLVRKHYAFCRELMRPKPTATKIGNRIPPAADDRKRLLVLPNGARSPADVMNLLVEAGLDGREVALLLLDHQSQGRAPDRPFSPESIASKHGTVRTALHERRKRPKAAAKVSGTTRRAKRGS